ncbi:MAG: response regulator transcription factor [Anaerolineae bacterium]|nr:response regulator transcription factor [Anaerolineae bacterium]
MIRILIVDDHAMVRQGLGQVLNCVDDFLVIGNACDGLEAVDLCHILEPDIVLMDVAMPKMDGLTASRMLHHSNPKIKIIVLSAFSDETLLQEALHTEVEVILSKEASINEILDTVYAVSGIARG